MKKTALSILISFGIGFVLGVLADRQMTADGHLDSQVHTDTITYIDTVRYSLPVPKDSIIIRHRSIVDTITITVDGRDSAIAASYDIPITQKEYEDTTYHAWISGFEPQLDSIHVFPKYQQITTTIIQTKLKKTHWGIGINSGVGYTANGFQPYIGIGIQYNIFAW